MKRQDIPAGTPIFSRSGEFLGQLTCRCKTDRVRMEVSPAEVSVVDMHHHPRRIVDLSLGSIWFGFSIIDVWFLDSDNKTDLLRCGAVAPAWPHEREVEP